MWPLLAWASTEGVSVIDASVGHVITTLPTPNVYELGFSPRGSYIITWERPSKDEKGDAVKNLKVWHTVEDVPAGGEKQVVGRFVQKNQTGWNLQYTFDERYCARVVTNEVQFYESGDLGTVWNKLRAEGVADFAISPGNNHSVAVFIPERKVNTKFDLLGENANNISRANHQLSRCSTSPNSPPLSRKRLSSRVTRFN